MYQPASDSCVLYNMNQQPICVGNLTRAHVRLRNMNGNELTPGYWRVWVCMGNKDDELIERMADLLLVQRQFHVSLQQVQYISTSAKRTLLAPSEEPVYKRTKAVGYETDHVTQTSPLTPQYARSIYGPGMAFFDLEGGQTALIESLPLSRGIRTDEKGVGMERYQVTRIHSIAQHPPTAVITCQHSKLGDKDIVAKILRCSPDEDTVTLMSCADASIRETTLLQKLNHVSPVGNCLYKRTASDFGIIMW